MFSFQESLEIIIQRFIDDIQDARMKDLERISFIMSLYDFSHLYNKEKILIDKILKDLTRRVVEIAEHPKTLPLTISYLLMCTKDVPSELLNCCLNPEFLKNTYSTSIMSYGREILNIDSFIEIYKPDWSGYRFDTKTKTVLCNLTQDNLPPYKTNLSKSDRLLSDIFNTLKELYEHVQIAHPLPHFQRPGKSLKVLGFPFHWYFKFIFFSDIILAIEQNSKKPIPLDEYWPVKRRSTVLKKSILFANKGNEVKLVAVVVGGWNLYMRNTNRPTGLLKQKIEQLEACGYDVILIHWQDWPTTADEQSDFISSRITNFLKNSGRVLANNVHT